MRESESMIERMANAVSLLLKTLCPDIHAGVGPYLARPLESPLYVFPTFLEANLELSRKPKRDYNS